MVNEPLRAPALRRFIGAAVLETHTFSRHPEVLAAQRRASKDGHKRRCSRPCFETPRKGAAPQDDGRDAAKFGIMHGHIETAGGDIHE
jgi:hypothetical protein